MASFRGIGVMSGTSLDGLDLCYAEFTGDMETDVWGYKIERATTVPYTDDWRNRLKNATTLSGVELVKLHVNYGHFVGASVKKFIETENVKVDFVASHGHTVFHQPEQLFTFQLGDGETTSTYLTCPFVCNFRAKDVALGGQGAPLVHYGEKFLFGHTDLCVNLGGIANVGRKGQKGFDMCPCNIILNKLAKQIDDRNEFDKDGEIASRGAVKDDLLDKLEALDYYRQRPPKSLGIEWIEEHVFPLLDEKIFRVEDIMRTFIEHIATRMASDCAQCCDELTGINTEKTVLITGGGAFNKTLMEILGRKLKEKNIHVEKTDDDTINFKEALVFAFLGMRALLGQENVTCRVTGSRCDSVSGSIHRPLKPLVTSPTLQDRFNFLMQKRQPQRTMSLTGD